MLESQPCPLCQNVAKKFAQNNIQEFFKCSTCYGVSANKDNLLNSVDEKKRYESHNNLLEDKRYINFLNKLCIPLKSYLEKGSVGLDFGCGPVKAIEFIMKGEHQVLSYDLYFYPDEDILDKKFDFIVASEVVEHLYYPQKTFFHFRDLLKDSGVLAIMTQTWDEFTDFTDWWYAKDPTHVFFYHHKTFEFICSEMLFKSLVSEFNVHILLKR